MKNSKKEYPVRNNRKAKKIKPMKIPKSSGINKPVKIFGACICALLLIAAAFPVFADGASNDPLQVIGNLSSFIFGLIRAIGIILLAFGIVQVGLSLKSHDPSQRANGFLTLAGGIIITFAKEILNLIAPGMAE